MVTQTAAPVTGAASTAFGALETSARLNSEQIDERAKELLAQLTLDEKVNMMSADPPFWPGLGDMFNGGYNAHIWLAGAIPRLGIPGIRFSDGPRGIVMKGATTFPVSMARGATWDVDLEERIGDVIGRELRALGGNFFGGVCINLLRHPAWGRAQETYGEDPHLLGEMGAALVRGVQRHVMACAKHYALNSMENARFKVDVTIDARAAARGLPAALQAHGGGRRGLDHERLQQRQRRVVRPECRAAARHPQADSGALRALL